MEGFFSGKVPAGVRTSPIPGLVDHKLERICVQWKANAQYGTLVGMVQFTCFSFCI